MHGDVEPSSTTVIHTAEAVPGIAEYYRCLIVFGDFTKTATSIDLFKKDRGFMELKAKEYANYNAAWTYRCIYESIYGSNPQNHAHPAY